MDCFIYLFIKVLTTSVALWLDKIVIHVSPPGDKTMHTEDNNRMHIIYL